MKGCLSVWGVFRRRGVHINARQRSAVVALTLALLGLLGASLSAAGASGDRAPKPTVIEADHFGISPAVRDLRARDSRGAPSRPLPRVNPLAGDRAHATRATRRRGCRPPRRALPGARADRAPEPRLRRHQQPHRLRRLRPTGHHRRRRPEPLHPDGERDQGRDLQQVRHPADPCLRPLGPVHRRALQPRGRRRPAGQLGRARQSLGAQPVHVDEPASASPSRRPRTRPAATSRTRSPPPSSPTTSRSGSGRPATTSAATRTATRRTPSIAPRCSRAT